jgi:multidrug resistance efflux pump
VESFIRWVERAERGGWGGEKKYSEVQDPERAMDSPIISTLPAGFRMDRQYGLVYDRVPSRTDDLTRILCVNAREASLLNGHGVFCFGQIALWRHRELSRFAEDLQVPLSRLIDEGWVSQAREFCRERTVESAGFPSAGFRTLTTLVCALLFGVLLVWVVANRQYRSIPGVLIAEVTPVKLPVSAVVQSLHVRPGDEVFTGQKLLTVERAEQAAALAAQQKQVRDAAHLVRRLEAQAVLDIESRRRQLVLEIDDLQQVLRGPGAVRPLARSGNSGMLFFSSPEAERKQSVAARGTSAAAHSGAPSTLTVEASARTVSTASAGRRRDQSGEDGEAAESMRQELTRLEDLLGKLREHVETSVGLTAAREDLASAEEGLQRLQSVENSVDLSAPGYGVVGAVDLGVGEQGGAGSTVVRILHLDKRSVLVRLPASRLAELNPGERVEVRFPGAKGYEGRVSTIAPMADSGEIAVRIEPAGRIWPAVPVGCEVQVYSWK